MWVQHSYSMKDEGCSINDTMNHQIMVLLLRGFFGFTCLTLAIWYGSEREMEGRSELCRCVRGVFGGYSIAAVVWDCVATDSSVHTYCTDVGGECWDAGSGGEGTQSLCMGHGLPGSFHIAAYDAPSDFQGPWVDGISFLYTVISTGGGFPDRPPFLSKFYEALESPFSSAILQEVGLRWFSRPRTVLGQPYLYYRDFSFFLFDLLHQTSMRIVLDCRVVSWVQEPFELSAPARMVSKRVKLDSGAKWDVGFRVASIEARHGYSLDSSAFVTPPGSLGWALTVRKSVRPLPSHRLALRYTSHHLDHFTSESSSSYSSSNHSLSGHTPPDTTDADTSIPQRFVHRSLARTLRCSEAYLHWRSAPLSTMYPLTTSASSAMDSSFDSSAGPSRKRYRSPAAIVTSSIHATRALVHSCADLLPPRKRFRDSILLEDSVEEDIDTDVLEDIEADATAVEVVVDRDVKARVDAGIDMEVNVRIGVKDEVEDEVESSDRGTMEVGVDLAAGIDILDDMLMPDAVERLEQVEEGLQDIYDHVIEIPLQRIKDIKMGQRELESRSLIAGG
ncbi:hypothetical protein Tco_1344974 [Tanacetum coccineum]